MREAAWYVVQVETGRESLICKTIERMCRSAEEQANDGKRILEECFSPRYMYQRKRHGEWKNELLPLLPGYVIAVTNNPIRLLQVMRGVPDFAKLLKMGETFAPLDEDEKSWIDRWTREGDRTILMSFAHKEGDKVVVTQGPLVGQEALITRINRRKSVAHLEIHAGQMTIHTTVGLNVLPEPTRE